MGATAVTAINRTGVANVPLAVQGMAGQTGDLQRWQDSAANIMGRVTNDGRMVLGWPSSFSGVRSAFFSNDVNLIAIVARGLGGQIANLQEWQNSAGAAVASVSPAGSVSGAHGFFTGGLNIGPNPGGIGSGSIRIDRGGGLNSGISLLRDGGVKGSIITSSLSPGLAITSNTNVELMHFGPNTATFADPFNFVLGTATGTKIGTAATQKLGFWDKAPIVQPSGLPAAATDLATALTLLNHIRSNVLLATGLAA